MPRYSNYPTLFDECLQLKISSLKKWGYLEEGTATTANVFWTKQGRKTGEIGILADLRSPLPYIELNYNYKGQPREYRVRLIKQPSNLGKGFFWLFECPRTKKRCLKLYSVNGYFYHREAFQGCFYETQVQSKRYRALEQSLGHSFRAEEYYSQLYRRYAKTHYQGKPTKWFLKVRGLIEKAEAVPLAEVEAFMNSFRRPKY